MVQDPNDDDGLVPCELAQLLLLDHPGASQVIVLREKGGSRSFPINIGLYEAHAISRRLHGQEMPRPLTHDLLLSVIEGLGASAHAVAVTDLVEDEDGEGTFFATLYLREAEGELVAVDCRPSDGVALAVRSGCDLFVAAGVLDKVT